MPAVVRPFVGRSRELGELDAALAGAKSASARLVLLRGEPGIGKTRLCEELSDRARAEGFTVAWGRCWETPGAPAYWPWRQLFDELAEKSAELDALLGGIPAHGTPVPAELTRNRLFELAAAALRARAERAPLLLVFEDLHAADLPSVQLLVFAARTLKRSRVLWLLSAREKDPRLSDQLEAQLSKLAREGTRLEPSRLDAGAVAELARALLDRPLSEHTLSQVVKATEGTPLYVDGTLRLIGSRPDVTPLPLPQSAQDVLRDRLDLMPASCRSVLELAAVVGHTFSRELLVAAAGGAQRDVADALARALEAGLLREVSFDAVGFAHALLREALYQGLPARRRAELHQVVFLALKNASPDELAHHALSSLPIGNVDDAVALAIKAARAAESLLAFERASELYERAVAVEQDTARQADLLLALSHAHVGNGRHQKAIAAAESAAALARKLSDAERLAKAALASGAVFRLGSVDRALVALLEEALAALGSTQRLLTVKVKARLASALQPAVDPRGPIALAKAAMDEARALGDGPTLMAALHFGLSAMADLSDAADREPYLRELATLAHQQKDRLTEHRAQARLAMAYYELGDIARADAAVRELDRLGAGLGPQWRLPSLLFASLRAQLLGRFADADRIAVEVQKVAEESDMPELLMQLGAHHCERLVLQARFQDIRGMVDHIIASMKGTPMEEQGADRLCGAYLWSMCGDFERARGYLQQIPIEALLYPDRGSLFWAGMSAGYLGDVERAKAIEAVVRPMADRFATGGLIAMTVLGPMSWPLALVVAAQGRKSEALEWLDRAREQCLAIGARAMAVRILVDRDRIAGTREHADEIASEAKALDLPGLLEAPPAPPSRQPSKPESLTLRRDGETWLLQPANIRLKDSRGVQMLATLLEHPGREFHVLELSGSDASAGGDAGEVLDAAAKADYRARLESLKDELEEAQRFNDPGRAERAQAEIDFIADELSAGVGLGGRPRKAASNAERARVNVQRRVKDALDRIEEQAPELGRRLRRAVRTGSVCVFENL